MTREPIRQQTVVAQVMDEIRNLIASGAFRPGDKIPTEKELAERFGIGRSSIREAIKIFNYLGVLESKAALGTFVQERSNISTEALTWSLLLGDDELEEIIDLRGSIELWCLLKLVNAQADSDPGARKTMNELQDIVDGMRVAADENRREVMQEDDFKFHFAIISSARIPLFISIYKTLRSFLQDEIRKSQADYEDARQIHQEHENLLAVIRKGHRLEVMAEYMAHIGNIKTRLEHQRG